MRRAAHAAGGDIRLKTVDTLGTFKQAIAPSSPVTRRVARRLRKLIAEVCPGVVEVPWPRLRVIGYGLGPKKSTEHFCYIGIYRTRVNLGFNYGARLPDPDGLLEGTGKKFRHVKVPELSPARVRGLAKLIRAAVAERKHAVATTS